MTMFDDTADTVVEEVSDPVGEAPESGQAEAEGTPTEVEYIDVDEYADRMVRIKVDGDEIEVPFREAVQGYQRQSDYTRKTQELAAQRQEVEQLRILANALQNNPQETIQFLQRQFGVAGAQGMVDAANAQAASDVGEPDPVDSRLAALEPRLQAFERYQAEQQLNATLSGLQSKYGDDFVADEVLSAAVEWGVTRAEDLEAVYKQMAFDRVYAARLAQNEVQERDARERAAREAAKTDLGNTVNTGPSAAVSSTATADATYSTVFEAFEAAKAELGL